MAKKDQKRRRQRRRRAAPSSSSGLYPFERADPPTKRLPVFFEILDDITSHTDDAIASQEGPLTRDQTFDLAVLVRANNLLKASRTLFAEGHWEVAASAARQLFELLVNMEHLVARPDPHAERLQYARFGLLQLARARARELAYERDTGREADEATAGYIDELMDGPAFDDFRTKNGKFRSTWSSKTTRALAESSTHGIRVKQYEQMFVAWSEETHAAPASLLEHILPKDPDGWVERAVAADDREIAQMTTMIVTLFLELWRTLPETPELDPDRALGWMSRILDQVRPGSGTTAQEAGA